jgi:hypothetical protein
MSPRAIALAVLSIAFATPVSASYIPDNNGRHLFVQDHVRTQTVRHVHHYRPVAKASKHRAKPRHMDKTEPDPGVARAAHHHRKVAKDTSKGKSPPWNMVKVRTVQGFYLTVHPAYAHKFLKLFALLQEKGINVPRDMVGCYSRSGHVGGSNHYIGAACDIQSSWNKTIPFMYHARDIIRQAGLYDGCSFGDCGHVEAVRGTHNRAPNIYAAMEKFKADESTARYQP